MDTYTVFYKFGATSLSVNIYATGEESARRKFAEQFNGEIVEVVRKLETPPAWIAAQAVRIHNQREWVKRHGGNEIGYIARYGYGPTPSHAGGAAIYAADAAALRQLESDFLFRTGQSCPQFIS